MKFLVDFFPVVAFFVAFYLPGDDIESPEEQASQRRKAAEWAR